MAMVNDLKKTRLLLNRLFTAQLINLQVMAEEGGRRREKI